MKVLPGRFTPKNVNYSVLEQIEEISPDESLHLERQSLRQPLSSLDKGVRIFLVGSHENVIYRQPNTTIQPIGDNAFIRLRLALGSPSHYTIL